MIVYNYYFAIFILAFIFFLLSNKKASVLLAIIIIIIIGVFYYYKIQLYENNIATNDININKLLNEDIKDRSQINDESYYLKLFPKNIKYLTTNKKLTDIILNIRFVKKYDYAKYTNLIYLFENFLKIYIYILADRYDIKIYFTSLIDLRIKIIKELYAIYVIIPKKLTNIYGIDPFIELDKSIKEFIIYSKKLINTVKLYGYEEKEIYYLEDTKYKPYIKNSVEVF